ncbi:hypothetical protein BZZ01_13575 [Nostocales cyanobacterium HT-58-2]|nr:hypothetical protein BZZ01_13575 [Nostocales cyanobacterium HT-58-2]
MKKNKARNKPGTVGVENKQGKLRLRLPTSVATGATRYISTRLDATPENTRLAQRRALEIQDDIERGTFDSTLQRYQFPIKTLQRIDAADIRSLWDEYCKVKQKHLAQTTYRLHYRSRLLNHIEKLPTHKLTDANKIKHHITSTLDPAPARFVLMHLDACCKWAVDAELITSNPFQSAASKIKVPNTHRTIDPFTAEERDAILLAYKTHPKWGHYYAFVQFLFMTGCRLGEACALDWADTAPELSSIRFQHSYNKRLKLVKDTKTHKARVFPCNAPLRVFLADLHVISGGRGRVFNTKSGAAINSEQITRLCGWEDIVGGLVDKGVISRYRTPYSTRHTFVSLAIKNGLTVSQVAALVGNTPEIILKHYASNVVEEVPVF